MQTPEIDVDLEEFSVEALEERFEMEAVVEPPETTWKSTCTYHGV